MLARIVDAIAPAREDVLVEIGPGEGVLTHALLERAPHLIAIEIDRDLAARLAEEFPPERLTVHCADALDFDFSTLPPRARIVGNLPYNISTPLLFRLAEQATRLRDLHFMLQREVVERMVARHSTPDYGRLSVMLQVRFRMKKLFTVAPGAFRPPPKVESAFVGFELRQPVRTGAAMEALRTVVWAAFGLRRKTLRNSLAATWGLRPTETVLAGLAWDARVRAESLSLDDFLLLTAAWEDAGKPGLFP